MACRHTVLQLRPSPFADLAGYEQPDREARAAAETISGKLSKQALKANERDRTRALFPGPLVLPHDDLNYDPDCSPQSTKSWLHAKTRNKMTPESGRGILYVSRVPEIDKDMMFMSQWTTIKGLDNDEKMSAGSMTSPDADLYVDYLRAFYHGMDVQLLPTRLSWTSWEKPRQPSRRANLPKYIGLAHGDQCTRIRVRTTPDGIFAAQLNLDDILDAAIEMLPEDAYALVLLIDHDMHESEEDDFCCGRAYGGSRVAVVQTARYNPCLDAREGIDRAHMWPMSHCKDYVDRLCAVEEVITKPPTREQIAHSKSSAMRSAVLAASEESVHGSRALWFSRLARTVSHELGHCLGIAHCVHYACNMQGTASMIEDLRQPPYLCPVCEAKVGHAISGELQGGGAKEKEVWVRQRNEALRKFCAELQDRDMASAMWRGLDGWLAERLEAL